MKKIFLFLALSFLLLYAACKKDTPAPYDYRDKWVGQYFCNINTTIINGADSPYVFHYHRKDTISVNKTADNDSSVDVTSAYIVIFSTYINKLGVGNFNEQPIKFYSTDSVSIYVINGGEGYQAWGLGYAEYDTYSGIKIK